MNPIRLTWLTTLTLLATHALAAPCSAQVGPTKDRPTCKVYSLADLAPDADMGAWIARTVPEVIQPGSWKTEGGSGVVSYFGPSKTLVVYHTPAVQVQVEAFLQSVKKTMPSTGGARGAATTTSMATAHQGVLPAQFAAPPIQQAAVAAPAAKSAYPIPAPMQQPKHLFHFIIRYEGDGAVDAGVAALAKVLGGDTSTAEESGDKAPTEPAKAGSVSQLFNIILRYEGDGIIDENVVTFMKAMQGAFSGPTGSATCVPGDPLVGRGTVNILPNAPTYVPSAQAVPAGSSLPSLPTTKDQIPTAPATSGSTNQTPQTPAPGSSTIPLLKAPTAGPPASPATTAPAGSGTLNPAPRTAPRPAPAAKTTY